MATKKTGHKTTKKPARVMRVSQSAIAQEAIRDITALYRKMALNPKSVKADKSRLLAVSGVPTKLIEHVAAIADQNGGKIAGMVFDSDGARQALAYAAAFDPVATEAESFAQRVRDSIVIAKSTAGQSTLAVYTALRGFVRSPEGADLRGAYEHMSQIMKERRGRQARREAREGRAARSRAGTRADRARRAEDRRREGGADRRRERDAERDVTLAGYP